MQRFVGVVLLFFAGCGRALDVPGPNVTPLSGNCSATPKQLASVSGSTTGLALDGDAVFWTVSAAGASNIMRSDKATGNTVAFVSGDTIIGVDGSTLVWETGMQAELYASDTTVAGARDLGVALASYQGSYDEPLLAADQGYVMWGDSVNGGGAFYSLPTDGSTSTPMHHALGASWVDAEQWSAFDGAMVWIADDTLFRAAVPAASAPKSLGMVGQSPIVGGNATTVYLWKNDSVVGISLADGTQKTSAALPMMPFDNTLCTGSPGIYGYESIIAGANDVFAAIFNECGNGSVGFSLWAETAPPVRLAGYLDASNAVAHLATDDACLYWVQNSASGDESATLWTVAVP